eukprot:10329952-Lingulodinium_polyedra.AAC.1
MSPMGWVTSPIPPSPFRRCILGEMPVPGGQGWRRPGASADVWAKAQGFLPQRRCWCAVTLLR